MAKTLSDTARVMLTSAAGRRARRLFPLPRLKAPPVIIRKTIIAMLDAGLLAAIPAEPDDEAWDSDLGEGRQTLIITEAGLAAIGFAPDPIVCSSGDAGPPESGDAEVTPPRSAETETTDDVPPSAAVASPQTEVAAAARAAASTEATGPDARPNRRGKRPGRRGRTPARKPEPKSTERRLSKQDVVLRLLRRQQGASVDEMMRATGWLPHSVRGFLAGALKRRLKIDVVSEKTADGERRYYVSPLRTDGDTA